jgi:hypothetical protein
MATCPKCQSSVSPADRFCPDCGASIASTFAAVPKKHDLPHTLQPSPKAQPSKMGERVALSVLMFIIALPVFFILDISWHWIDTGNLIIAIPYGFELRGCIFLAVLAAIYALIDD